MDNSNAPENELTAEQRAQTYNATEQELIQQLVKSRLEQHEDLEYDPLNDYDIPPAGQFYMLAKPAVTFNYPHVTFSASAVRLFEGVEHVLPMFAEPRRRFSILPLSEEDAVSLRWSREKDGKWIPRSISAPDYLDDLFAGMQWSRKVRYKAFGHIANSPRGLILAFNLGNDIVCSTTLKREVTDPKTGEVKQKRTVFYPSNKQGRVGTPIDEYFEGRQLTIFDDFDIQKSKTLNDIPEEFMKEEEAKAPITATNDIQADISRTAAEIATMSQSPSSEGGMQYGINNY